MGPAVFVKLPAGAEEALREEAGKDYRPISTLIRAILLEWLDERGIDWRGTARPKARRAAG